MRTWTWLPVAAALLSGMASAQALHPLEAKDLAWRKRPNGDDMARYFPIEARNRELPGWVIIECLTEEKGDLKDCQVLNETPTGVGFGDAGLALAKFFKLDARKMAPELLAGGVLTIPILMQTPDGVSRPLPPRNDLAGDPSALLIPAKGGNIPCPAVSNPEQACLAHAFSWSERPGLKATAPFIRAAASTPSMTAMLCRIGGDMKLDQCVQASPAKPSQVAAMNGLLPLFKAPYETREKVSAKNGFALVQFDWQALKRAVDTSVHTRP
jgi:hypothetical protein